MQTNEHLLELYKEHKSAEKVEYAINGELSARQIQRRLAKAFPKYAKGDYTPAGEEPAHKEDLRPIAGGIISSPDKRRTSLAGKKFVFTAAQNNTYVHQGFLDSLKTFCNEKQAELFVSAFAYNKSGFQNGTKDSDELWYDPQIVPYLWNESVEVARGLIFCGELDILPTASNPLSGLGNYCQGSSGIVPHAKVQMESLPRMKGEDARFLYTTGAVTQRNYIQRKAGQKAEFHHVFAALYVEVDEQGDWFARQLIAGEDGTFFDLTTLYKPDGIEKNRKPAAITWGDIHLEKLETATFAQIWGDGFSMLNILDPAVQFIHDLTDFRARNHHNIEDPFFLAEMHFNKQSNVERDLLRCGSFLEYITRFGNKAVVVESNHDQALEKWLREADIRKDPENAEFYHRANTRIHKSIRLGEEFHVFKWAVTADGTLDLSNVMFLKEDDSYVVLGIEQGMHGHRGPNGSRGNPRGFRNIGRKVNIGHMHSAGIHDGVYVAGVSGSLDMGYNKGPSSWSHSHIVTYPNGKRTIITMKNGKWRA